MFTVSNYSAKKLTNWLKKSKDIPVIYNTFERKAVQPDFDTVPPCSFILFVGNESPHKNFNRLQKAFIASNDTVASTLVAVGVPNQRNFSNHNKSILYFKNLPDSKLFALYQRAEFLVVPSLDEGFCLPAFEAYEMGTQVLHSDRGALPEVVGESLVKFNPKNVDEIQKALEQFQSFKPVKTQSKKIRVQHSVVKQLDVLLSEVINE